MKWIDLLRMSQTNLVRRKLRTLLTVLGVVIGTSSIVIMVSLGLGLQQSISQQIEQFGGVTRITVTTPEADSKKTTKQLTNTVVEQFKKIEHINHVSPILRVPVQLQKGNYVADVQLTGMTTEALQLQNLPIEHGRLPETTTFLEYLPGNSLIMNFYVKGTRLNNSAYYEDASKIPKIDLATEPVFLSFVQSRPENMGTQATADNSITAGARSASAVQTGTTAAKQAKKYTIRPSGKLKGVPTDQKLYSNEIYVTIDALLHTMKKEQNNGVLPGQPTTRSGGAYPYIVYSEIMLRVDQAENVKPVVARLRSMGYQVTSNAEQLDSTMQQMAMIQSVLGAIGAVSLIVAAIGITNTMMMSIYERTKEIGVIKVLGCGLTNIKQMFLIEAAFIGLFGGIVGNGLSFIISWLINLVTKGSGTSLVGDSAMQLSQIPLWLVATSLLFSTLVGMSAGYFPAVRAIKLSPLVAING